MNPPLWQAFLGTLIVFLIGFGAGYYEGLRAKPKKQLQQNMQEVKNQLQKTTQSSQNS